MTKLLQDAFAAIAQLPDDQQNAIATRLLAELKKERLSDLGADLELQQEIQQARAEYQRGEYVTLSELKAKIQC